MLDGFLARCIYFMLGEAAVVKLAKDETDPTLYGTLTVYFFAFVSSSVVMYALQHADYCG